MKAINLKLFLIASLITSSIALNKTTAQTNDLDPIDKLAHSLSSIAHSKKGSLGISEEEPGSETISTIFHAAQAGNLPAFKRLITEEDLDINDKDKEGNTVLHAVFKKPFDSDNLDTVTEIVDYLTSKDINLTILNNDKKTPGQLAFENGYPLDLVKKVSSPTCGKLYGHLRYWGASKVGPNDPTGHAYKTDCLAEIMETQ